MDPHQHLRSYRPLIGLSPSERRGIYQGCGMHSPSHQARTDADAFEIRSDVGVEDACVTALRLIRAAIEQLDLLIITPDLPLAYRGVVEGICFLSRLAGGSVGLVQAALTAKEPTEQPGAEALWPRPR